MFIHRYIKSKQYKDRQESNIKNREGQDGRD